MLQDCWADPKLMAVALSNFAKISGVALRVYFCISTPAGSKNRKPSTVAAGLEESQSSIEEQDIDMPGKKASFNEENDPYT